MGHARADLGGHEETAMTDPEFVEKTPLDKSRDIITQLKEMQHYSKSNIEKLTAFWLQLDDELKLDAIAKRVEALLTVQNTFHEALESTIEDFESACEGMDKNP